MSRVIVFDVNETLLGLKALDAHFERAFRRRRAPGIASAVTPTPESHG